MTAVPQGVVEPVTAQEGRIAFKEREVGFLE